MSGDICYGQTLLLTVTVSSIGCFVLFETVPRGQRYAARITSMDGRNANLTWHTDNIYATGEAPKSATFTQGVRACTEAVEDAFMNALPRTKVSSYLYANYSTY